MNFFKIIVAVVLIPIFITSLQAGDLYRVDITSRTEADLLRQSETEPVVKTANGYLVLVEADEVSGLVTLGLDIELVATDVRSENIFLDGRLDDYNKQRFEILYEENGLRVYRADQAEIQKTDEPVQLFPVESLKPTVVYLEASEKLRANPEMLDLTSLISNLETDSLISYVETLQAFDGRVAGTANNNLSRDWVYNKLIS